MDDLPVLDAHAHVWDRTCRYVAGSRYRPAYEATIDDYLRVLDDNGIDRAVLVQPSFLGTDNSYLLAALRAYPDRLRGIVVVDPAIGEAELDAMTDAGAIGLRYNLLSMSPRALALTPWQALTSRAAARGWWVEVQANAADWPRVLPHLADARLMVDHFGKPSGPACPGLTGILERDPAMTCVKLSAPYRVPAADLADIAGRLIAHFGAARCLWGSDWPWTRNEGQHTYAECRQWLGDWTRTDDRKAMKQAAPHLAGFGP